MNSYNNAVIEGIEEMRVILAEDQPDLRSALRLLLGEKPDITVIAETTTSNELLRQARAGRPDLLLLDWELPKSNPEELVLRLHLFYPRLSIIALSNRPQMRSAALKTGVRYFVCKSEPPEHLLMALDNCYNEKMGSRLERKE